MRYFKRWCLLTCISWFVIFGRRFLDPVEKYTKDFKVVDLTSREAIIVSKRKFVVVDHEPISLISERCKTDMMKGTLSKLILPKDDYRVRNPNQKIVITHCDLGTDFEIIPKKLNYDFTVCHPVMYRSKIWDDTNWHKWSSYELPSEKLVREWVSHYLNAGFQHVFIYVQENIAIYEIEHVTWYRIAWAKDDKIYNGGQLWAMHHCLYLNKMLGTKWALFLDVDEFLVERRNFNGVRNLSQKILATEAELSDIYSFTFGQYLASNDIVFHNETSILRKLNISQTPLLGPLVLSNSGKRKQLVNVKYACELRVHGDNGDSCQENRKIVNMHTDEFAVVHASGLQKSYK